MVATAAAGCLVGSLLSSPGATASNAVGTAAAAIRTASRVTLLTGDVVTLSSTDGHPKAVVQPTHPNGAMPVFTTIEVGSHAFVIPASARPYVGAMLDPALFDVTALSRHPSSDVRVRVTTRAGVTFSGLPGATLQRTGDSSYVATFSPNGAREFGAALARQAAIERANPASADRLLGAVTHIGPMRGSQVFAPRASKATTGGGSMLTIKGIDNSGHPDNGDEIFLINLDDSSSFWRIGAFSSGRYRVKVPNGHYTASVFFEDLAHGTSRAVNNPEFDVTGPTSFTLDARDATSKITVDVPRPQRTTAIAAAFGNTDALGSDSFSADTLIGPGTMYVAPHPRRILVGEAHFDVDGTFANPLPEGKAKTPHYLYHLNFPRQGGPQEDQHYVVATKSLATIHATYAANHARQTSSFAQSNWLPWEQIPLSVERPFITPRSRTEYFSARANLLWQLTTYASYNTQNFDDAGELDSSVTAYRPGTVPPPPRPGGGGPGESDALRRSNPPAGQGGMPPV